MIKKNESRNTNIRFHFIKLFNFAQIYQKFLKTKVKQNNKMMHPNKIKGLNKFS